MILVGLALSLFAVAFLCWLLFALAVYATPFFVGVTAAFAAFSHNAGVIGALIVGLAASVVTLVACRVAFAVAKSPAVRSALALAFATPATIAGFHATLGLARMGVSSEIWRDLFAVTGAVLVGCTAFIRLARAVAPISHERSVAFTSAQSPSPPLAPSTTRDRRRSSPSSRWLTGVGVRLVRMRRVAVLAGTSPDVLANSGGRQ